VTPQDQATANKLRKLRETYEAERSRILDDHMAKHYPGKDGLWIRAVRASIEVESWPEWKRRACYAQSEELAK
jgi:hypothetical protein